MKRTKAITLTLLAGASLTLPSCSQEKAVQTVDQCMEVTGNSALRCKNTIEKAKAEADKTAPKFTSKEECVKEFGESKCEQRSGTAANGSSTSWFIPAAMGYMMGRSSSSNAYVPPAAFQTRDGDTYTSKSYSAARVEASRSGHSSVSSHKSSVTRGGFGSSYSSFGG
jgi:uncharacterized protein YgiB involved in biofilm formation